MTAKRKPSARAQLWAELFALAEREKVAGDGRALRLLERYRDVLERPAPTLRA